MTALAVYAVAALLVFGLYLALFPRRMGPWDGREGREEPGAREEDRDRAPHVAGERTRDTAGAR